MVVFLIFFGINIMLKIYIANNTVNINIGNIAVAFSLVLFFYSVFKNLLKKFITTIMKIKNIRNITKYIKFAFIDFLLRTNISQKEMV